MKSKLLSRLDPDFSEYCYTIAKIIATNNDSEFSKVLANYMVHKSNYIIDCYLNNISDFNKIDRSRIINKGEKLRSIVKYLVYKFYFIIGFLIHGKKPLRKNCIRSWVDDAYKLFSTEYNNSTVLLYPFVLNFRRYYEYIKFLIINNYDFRITGINYSLFKLLKYLFTDNDPVKYIEFEVNAHKHHSTFLQKFDKIYTSDDFMIASIILYQNHENVINKAHGIGFYNIFNSYSKHVVFNDPQLKYYSKYSNDVKYAVMHGSKDKIEFDLTSYSSIIIIDQARLLELGLVYESELQKKCYKYLSKKFENVSIKFHPNRIPNERKSILDEYGFTESNSFKKESNVAYFNLFSTVYYELDRKDIFFPDCEEFPIERMFGNQINKVKLEC